MYGRMFETPRVLAFVDDQAYRREMNAMRSFSEGRDDLAGTFPRPQGRAVPGVPSRHVDQLGDARAGPQPSHLRGADPGR
jgi:hypothetical protein